MKHHLHNRIAIIALLGASLTLASAHAQTLLEMVEATTAYDAQWQAALAEREAAARRADQARAALLPSVGAGAELARAHTRINPTGTHFTGTAQSASIAVSQPLYRPAQRIQWEQSKIGIAQMNARLDASAQLLILRVAQAYFAVLAAQDALQVVQAQKKAVQEQLTFAQRNFEVGNATITDTREAQAQFDLIRAQEIAALNTLQVRQLALRQTTGLPAATPAPLAEPVTLPVLTPNNIDAWLDSAQQHQPGIRQAQLALDAARLETDKAETGHLPTVDLAARLSHMHTPQGSLAAPGHDTRTNQGSIGVQLNMPLFAGFAVQNRVKETLALEEQARANLQHAQREVIQNTQAAFFDLQSGHSRVEALQAAEASSLSALQANQLGYEVGVRINIDVLNAQSQLYQTRRDLAQARYNVLLGSLQLEYAAGVLDMDSVKRINALLAPASPPAAPQAPSPAGPAANSTATPVAPEKP